VKEFARFGGWWALDGNSKYNTERRRIRRARRIGLRDGELGLVAVRPCEAADIEIAKTQVTTAFSFPEQKHGSHVYAECLSNEAYEWDTRELSSGNGIVV
jgi:hypothetical protein